MVFNNQQRSGYDELKSYYPLFYKNILEMDAIFQICGRMLDGMATSMEQAVLNRFVETMDEESTTRIEQFFYLSSNKNRPIEERKLVIMATLIGFGEISVTKIKSMINKFIDTEIEVNLQDEYLQISINKLSDSNLYVDDILEIVGKRIPAHLATIIVFQNPYLGGIYVGATMQQAEILNIRQVI